MTQQWISVNERLPEAKPCWNHSERVLLWYEGDEHNINQYGIGYYNYSPPFNAPGFTDFHYAFNGRKPTHWMPLPAPPGSEEDDLGPMSGLPCTFKDNPPRVEPLNQ